MGDCYYHLCTIANGSAAELGAIFDWQGQVGYPAQLGIAADETSLALGFAAGA